MQFARAAVSAPEGDAPTRARVVQEILENGPSTAAALAELLELTPAAVRRHLDQLLEDGIVESSEERVYGSRRRGRPARVFSLTTSGRDGLEHQYDALAVDALRFLSETGGEEAVTAFARRRMETLADEFDEIAAGQPESTPAQVLAEALSRRGFSASVRSLPMAEQLCQQHCPVAHVAAEFPQLCEAETEAISAILGRHVQRLATIAHGDGVCTTSIPTQPIHEQNRESHS